MNSAVHLQAVSQVLLRLLAFSFFVQGMSSLLPIVLTLSRNSPFAQPHEALPYFILGAFIASAGVVWAFAPALARLVARGTGHGLVLPGTLADWYSIGFVAVGIFHVSNRLGSAFNWAHFFLKGAAGGHGIGWQEEINWYDVSSSLVPFAAGILLLLNARSWGVKLARKHHAEEAAQQDEAS